MFFTPIIVLMQHTHQTYQLDQATAPVAMKAVAIAISQNSYYSCVCHVSLILAVPKGLMMFGMWENLELEVSGPTF